MRQSILYSRFVNRRPSEPEGTYARRFWRVRAVLDGIETAAIILAGLIGGALQVAGGILIFYALIKVLGL